ncbi:NAD(P)/FAD-dependent oxidoreductase [Haloplanus halophilus]|uniref:NAD(P)/FAD-dependent oxidoreductase n=1 Tax=Haloplanus halophilus TaxID=2949993 RepID=UPI00203E0B99|nr:FAD-dependent monooxygenase [Haloplanus sp. GDY1]
MTLATAPGYDADRVTARGDHAVVVGAGVAGLLAARVLADAFDAVTVLERDPPPAGPVARRGVPQARHIHVMLEAGRATLEALFPGYCRDLLDAGGLELDGARDVRFYAEGGFLADGPRCRPQYAATRPLYEWLLRRRVVALDGVRIRSGCHVTDYRTDGRAVTGVVLRTETGTERLDADLTVDASGRASRTPAWLADSGYAPPAVDEVRIDLAYSTALVRRPSADRRAFVVTPDPSCPRAASVLPVEGNRWIVTVGGVHGDRPPTDPAGVVAFAAGLPIPHVRRVLETREWVDEDVAHYPFPTNRRHRYECLDRLPAGLLVVGDAVASFNPLYAQGMSVAALEARHLHDALATTDRPLAPAVARRVGGVVDTAWLLAVGADCRFPETTGPRPRGAALVNRYLSRLTRRAHADGVLREALFRVLSMERPPTTLVHPRLAWRVLAPAGRP